MFDIQKPIPAYLLIKGNVVNLIVFTAAFALFFINIYAPFGVVSWYDVDKWELLLYSSMVILTGVLVVVVSRIIMYYKCKKKIINYWQYAIWVFFEIFFMAIFYTIFIKKVLHNEKFFLDILKVSMQNTALILLLPYSVLWLYFSWKDKKEKLESITESPNQDPSQQMVAFFDEKGVLRLSLKMDNLLYLEASDNYVNIIYLHKDKINKFLLRNTLKKLEHLFDGTEIVRCHRSYMINFKKVKVIRKDKDGLKLELDLSDMQELPVSKTYADVVMETFMKYCKVAP